MEGTKSRPLFILLVSMAALFIVAWGIRASAPILNPILLAVVITIVALPLPAKLAKRGLPGWLSFVLTLVIVVGGIALVAFVIFISISQIPADFAGQSSGGPISGFLTTGQIQQVEQFIVKAAVNGLVLMGMVFLIFIFMLSAAVALPSGNRLGLSADSPALKSIAQLTKEVRQYMSIMTSVNFFVGLGDVFLLWVLGVPYAVLWGLLGWLMGYIPTVGFWIALIPPVFIAWQQQGVQAAALVFLGYVLINGSVQNFVQPRMMGQGLGISPVVVFISLFVWGWLFGGVGAILAVPLTLLIMAILNSNDNTRFLATLMSLTPAHKKDDQAKAKHQLGKHWDSFKSSLRGDDKNSQPAQSSDAEPN